MLRSKFVRNAQHSCKSKQYLQTKTLNYMAAAGKKKYVNKSRQGCPSVLSLTIPKYCNVLAFGLNNKQTFPLLQMGNCEVLNL